MMSIHDDAAVAQAVSLLQAGQLVAFPTETVYGLGADAENDAAVAAIFSAKGRPSFNPLILHIAGPASSSRYAEVSARAARLMAAFWPGPLTLILPRRRDAPSSLLVSAGMDTVALRMPDHPFARDMLDAFGRAVAAPSANRSGRVSPTEAAHVAAEFAGWAEGPALILDGGACKVGLESTILDMTGNIPLILRPGAVTLEMIRAVAPEALGDTSESRILAPGMMASHYAPRLPVRLHATFAEEDEALLAFGPHAPPHRPMLNLSVSGDLCEAAAHLFAYLRRLDQEAASRIAVMEIPMIGLGLAINDRLRRAAAPRKIEA